MAASGGRGEALNGGDRRKQGVAGLEERRLEKLEVETMLGRQKVRKAKTRFRR